MQHVPSILIAGYGAMTGAMVEGWLRAGLPAERFTAYDPQPRSAPAGVTVTSRLPKGPFDIVLLGVKPQALAAAAPALEPLVGPHTVLISVLAGVELASLARHFPRAGGTVRLLPNLAVALGKSANALVASGLDRERQAVVTALAEMLGGAEWMEDEAQCDLVTALGGSGPAFVYRFIDALAAGGTRLGLDGEQAQRLALRMVEGAAALAAVAPQSPAELARKVASPGGTTEAGLDVLDEGEALVRLVTETLRAARDRSREMAAAARTDD